MVLDEELLLQAKGNNSSSQEWMMPVWYVRFSNSLFRFVTGEKEDAVSALLGVGCESGWGGGISVFDGFLTLGNINGGGTILRNKVILVSMSTLTAKGGGVGALKSEVLMSGWTLEDNSAISEGPGGEMGGGVYMSNSIAEWNSLRVYNNFVGSELYLSLADSGGGGVCVEGKKMYLNAMGLDMQGNRVLPGGNGGGLWVNNGAIVNIRWDDLYTTFVLCVAYIHHKCCSALMLIFV